MSDFFERNEKKYKNLKPSEVEKVEKKLKKKSKLTFDFLSKLKWRHIEENKIEGQISGKYILGDFEDNPIINYSEESDCFMVSRGSFSSYERSFTFRFDRNGIDIESSSNHISSHYKFLPHGGCFLWAFYSDFQSEYEHANRFGKNKGKKMGEMDVYSLKELAFQWHNNYKEILKHLGGVLIRKSYEHGSIDKSSYKVLLNSFNDMCDYFYSIHEEDKGISEEWMSLKYAYGPLLQVLLIQLNFRPCLSLLSSSYTKKELLSHWNKSLDSFLSNNTFFGNFNSVIYYCLTNGISLNNANDFIVDIFGGNKRMMKKIFCEWYYSGSYLLFISMHRFKDIIKKDWLIHMYYHRSFGEIISGYIQSCCRASIDILGQPYFRCFIDNYLVTETLRRDFCSLLFCDCLFEDIPKDDKSVLEFTVDEAIDIFRMYVLLPIELRPIRCSFKNLHGRLVEIHNNHSNFFLNSDYKKIEDDYEFAYDSSKFKDLLNLDGVEVGGYKVDVPKTAKEIRDGGIELKNCLASYVYMVEADSSLIMYLIKEGEKKYAIEIKLREESETGSKVRQFYVDQFYGERNSMPFEKDFQVFRDYIKLEFSKIADSINEMT